MKRSNGCKKWVVLFVLFVALLPSSGSSANGTGGPVEITILYDNVTRTEGCTADWGFACIIKGMEKCILFDTGTNGSILLGNMDKLQVSAEDVELVVISHDHADHTGGLASFLGRNSDVTAYLPLTASAGLVQIVQSRGATVELEDEPVQICEGVHVAGATIMGQVEQYLILETPKGLVVITGCAHPGIVQIVQAAKQLLDKDIYFVFGGFHLLDLSDSAVLNIIQQFKLLGVQKAGASHCTGDRAIALFKQQYGEHFVPLGVGPLAIPVSYDFNRDEVIDCADLCIIVDHWLTSEPSCDLAPRLFGDGIVDIQDLVVVAEHLFEEALPFGLIAYWRLDETEGTVASDSAGDKDGTLNSNPLWQPATGKVFGALQFDGIDDYISTPFILNPYSGPFSVFVWIKSDAAGKVIISQKTGANWLLTNSSGKLCTELKASGTSGQTLLSQAIITDGNWHRIGFVRDGTSRILYVDDVEVIRDTQTSLAGSGQGLYIGAAKGLESAKFFSGLIDDVRIYDRAIIP